jgi:hypothetical protein
VPRKSPSPLRQNGLRYLLMLEQGTESQNKFSRRLGIDPATWCRIRLGDQGFGALTAARAFSYFPGLRVLRPDVPGPRISAALHAQATFWDYVNEFGPTPEHVPELGPCWLWTGDLYPNGYGYSLGGPKTRYAHRAAWLITKGPIPSRLYVLHKCDNPPCVRPSHLWLGTALDNAQDRDRKGRSRWHRRRLQETPSAA